MYINVNFLNKSYFFLVATIFYAVKLAKAELPEWMDWVLVAFVAFHVLMHLLFSVSKCVLIFYALIMHDVIYIITESDFDMTSISPYTLDKIS